MKMFDDMADKLFEQAGVSKKLNPDVWQQAVDILSQKMATLSVYYGLICVERVEAFEAQKQTLLDDLLQGKKDGDIK